MKKSKYQDISVFVPPNQTKTIKGIEFEINGEKFAFIPPKYNKHSSNNYIHIKSGSGMGTPPQKPSPTEKNSKQKFQELIIDRVGKEKFWETIKKQKSIQEKIDDYNNKINLLKSLNNKLKKIDPYLIIKEDYRMGIFGIFSIDIIDFDDRLKQFYPDDYKDNMSMKQIMIKKFRKKFTEQFEQLLNK